MHFINLSNSQKMRHMHISEATNLFIFSNTSIHKKEDLNLTVFNYSYTPLIGN